MSASSLNKRRARRAADPTIQQRALDYRAAEYRRRAAVCLANGNAHGARSLLALAKRIQR